jgi:hypothetical protein
VTVGREQGYESVSLRAGAYAVADWLQGNPKKVRFGMVEMLWAGELTSAWRDSFFQNYLDTFEAGNHYLAVLPYLGEEAARNELTMQPASRAQP